MARSWTPEQAASLAPDASALKAAQGLGSSRKWTLLGCDDGFLWGLAQGSGANPYQVQVDLGEPAFKCSCPSRKFPCKHGLGLLLVHASQPGAFKRGLRPDWVEEWAAKRADRTAKQEAKTPAPETAAAPDPEAQAKRREKRAANIAQGVAFLDGWLRDLARQGLAATSSAGYQFWDVPARRLIDAQAPGLARRVRELGGVLSASDAREEAGIASLGRLHLLVSAAARRAELPEEWQEEVDSQIGLTVDQEELRSRDGVRGTWFVGAQTVHEEEKLIVRVSHLFSTEGRDARILEFSHAARPSVASMALGRWFGGDLVFYPGVRASRAIWKSAPEDCEGGTLSFLEDCEALIAMHADTLAANPLADPLAAPVRLTPVRHGGRWWLHDECGSAVPAAATAHTGWLLMSCSGGLPLEMFGLWDGFEFTPLSAMTAEGVIPLGPQVAVHA